MLSYSFWLVVSVSFRYISNEQFYADSDLERLSSYASAIRKGENEIELVDHRVERQKCLARGAFMNGIQRSGWGHLLIETGDLGDDEEKAYAAGLVEAHLTYDLIVAHAQNIFWLNLCNMTVYKNPQRCDEANSLFDEQDSYMKSRIEQFSNDTSFWYHTNLVLYQLNGIADRMQKDKNFIKNNNNAKITNKGVYLNFGLPDTWELDYFMKGKSILNDENLIHPYHFDIQNTLFVKKLIDGKILAGHTTWGPFESMLRIHKRYDFKFQTNVLNHALVRSPVLTFTSYPGIIHSPDTFILSSDKILAMNTKVTTRLLSHESKKTERCIPKWIRVMVASRLAQTSSSWLQNFIMDENTTNPDQWTIVDFKESNNRVFLGEAITNDYTMHRLDGHLQNNNFFSAFGVPFTNASVSYYNYHILSQEFGENYVYETNAKRRMFLDENPKIKTTSELKDLMVLNRFGLRPETIAKDQIGMIHHLPSLTIAGRFDLLGHIVAPALYSWNLFGAIDAKVINSTLADQGQFFIKCGPSNDQVPRFVWGRGKEPKRQPISFTFDYIIFDWSHFDSRPLRKRSGKRSKKRRRSSRH